jgi:hypothetical protein
MNLSLIFAILSVFLFQQRPSFDSLDLHNVQAEPTSYRGRNAIRIIDTAPPTLGDAGRLASIKKAAGLSQLRQTNSTHGPAGRIDS